jgi:outer membrane translocation and assembly module TamA
MFSLRTTDRGKRIAEVTVTVNEGTQYRLGSIEFQNKKLFPTGQMRKLFALQDGDVFNGSKFVNGMENLRRLYEAAGYAEAVVVPQEERNEQLHTVDWVLDVQEGWQYHFGRLILDGLEPHAGAAQSLLNSWKTIHGKQYNPIVLQQWLMANRSDWRPAKHTSRPIPAGLCADPITQVPDGELRVVNVKLSFPEISPSDHIDCGGRTN